MSPSSHRIAIPGAGVPAHTVSAPSKPRTGAGDTYQGWIPIGPFGSDIVGLDYDRADNRRIYALLCEEGLFRSPDSGESWERVHGYVYIPHIGEPVGMAVGSSLVSAVDSSVQPASDATIGPGVEPNADQTAESTASIEPDEDPNSPSITPTPDPSARARPAAPLARPAAAPARLYILNRSGIRISRDAGETWEYVGFSPHTTADCGPIVDPLTPGTIYAAGQFYNENKERSPILLKSDDGGSSWSYFLVDPRFSIASVICLAVSPSSPNVLYLCASDANRTACLIFRSVNGGRDWSPAQWSPDDPDVRSLAVHPRDPNRLFAGTHRSVFRSLDAGASWTPSIDYVSAAALAVDPSNPQVLHASAYDQAYKSLDGGVTWTSVTAGLSGLAAGLRVAGSSIFRYGSAGVHRSDDGGLSWRLKTAGTLGAVVQAVAVAPSYPWTIYVAVGGFTLMKSINAGGTWQPIPKASAIGLWTGPFPDPRGPRLVVHPNDNRRVYIQDGNEIHRSLDGVAYSSSWTRLLSAEQLGDVALSPTHPNVVYATGQIRDGGGGGGSAMAVFVSSDGGDTWSTYPVATAAGTDEGCGYAIASPPGEPATIYVGGSSAIASDIALCSATDPTALGSVPGFAALGIIPGPSFGPALGPASGSAHICTPGSQGPAVSGSAFGPAVPGSVLSLEGAGTASNPAAPSPTGLRRRAAPGSAAPGSGPAVVYKTTDGGSRWVSTALPIAASVYALAADPFRPGTAYAGLAAGIFRTLDGGASWSQKSSFEAVVIEPDPASRGWIFAAGGQGVFASADHGDHWSALGPGLPAPVLSLSLDASSHALYAATTTGVYRLDLDSAAAVISGTVKDSGRPLPGVRIAFSDSVDLVTDKSGRYARTVPLGWFGSATTSKAGYAFDPPGCSLPNVFSDLASQDYAAFLESPRNPRGSDSVPVKRK